MPQKKVSFIVAGVQKSGTTSLDRYLRFHPDILMPRDNRKELQFFTLMHDKGYEYYHSHFSTPKHQLLGECSPLYIYWSKSLEKIYDYNPEMKVIVVLRNPIERAYSHWNMEYAHGREGLLFIDSLKCESTRLSQPENYRHRVYSYIDRGKYCRQINDLYGVFEKKQVLILKSDDLFNDSENTLNKIFSFLGLSEIPLKETIKLYSGNYAEPMSIEAHDYLFNCFESEIKELGTLLNWDCAPWLES